MTTIADHLRAHLTISGKSMRALSLEAGLHAKAVSEIVNGVVKRPRVVVLEALSPIVGVDLAAIPVRRPTRCSAGCAAPGLLIGARRSAAAP